MEQRRRITRIKITLDVQTTDGATPDATTLADALITHLEGQALTIPHPTEPPRTSTVRVAEVYTSRTSFSARQTAPPLPAARLPGTRARANAEVPLHPRRLPPALGGRRRT